MCILRPPSSLGIVLSALFVVAGTAPTDACAQDKMYWTVVDPGIIQRADLDGSNVENVVVGLNSPRPIFVNEGKIYWADFTTQLVQRANIDGSNVETIVSGETALGMTIAGSKIYYSQTGTTTDSIFRANFDGSGEELLIDGLDRRSVLCIIASGGKIYVTDRVKNRIFRANLDGSNITDIVSTGLQDPNGIAVDVSGGKLYWTDTGTNKIQRSNLDGSNVENLVTGGSANLPVKISLDINGGKMYWTSFVPIEIRRADLAGSNVEVLLTDLAIHCPIGIFIDGPLVGLPPSTSWVDFGFVGIETGSNDNPFDTLAEGLAHTLPSGTVMIKGDTGDSVSNETMSIEQAVTIKAVNGTVRIGDSAGRSADSGRQAGFVSRD